MKRGDPRMNAPLVKTPSLVQTRESDWKCRAAVARLGLMRIMGGFAIMVLAACATQSRGRQAANGKKEAFQMYQWHGEGVGGSPSIVIYLDEQKAHFFR